LQRTGPLAVADEDHGAAVEVQDDSQVPVPAGHGDLVDGDVAEVLELGLGVPPRQVAPLDVLDEIPADIEVMGDVLDGHAPGQLQGVASEGLGVAPPGVGEGDIDLADGAAGRAFDAGDGQDDGGGPAADGQGAEAALGAAAGDDLAGAAGRAAAVGGVLGDGEGHLAASIVGADVVVTADAEGRIQKAGGHAALPVRSPLTQLQVESACPRFSSPAHATSG